MGQALRRVSPSPWGRRMEYHMFSRAAAGILAGFVLGSAALAQDPAPAPEAGEAETGDFDAGTVLATVDGVEITLGHAIVMRERLPEQYQSLPDEVLLSGIVDQLIDQTLLAAQASPSAEADPLEVRLHLENERRGSLSARIVQERVGAPVEEAAVEAAYAARIEAFEPQKEYSAAHILVETEQEAKDLITQIEGGADFAELATANSKDPGSAPNGGALGWFGAGQMVPEFETAAAALEPGAISAPVQTQFGWHVIRLDEVRDTAPPALEQVRGEIENAIRQERLEGEIEALRADASIDRPEGLVTPGAIRQTDLVKE